MGPGTLSLICSVEETETRGDGTTMSTSSYAEQMQGNPPPMTRSDGPALGGDIHLEYTFAITEMLVVDGACESGSRGPKIVLLLHRGSLGKVRTSPPSAGRLNYVHTSGMILMPGRTESRHPVCTGSLGHVRQRASRNSNSP